MAYAGRIGPILVVAGFLGACGEEEPQPVCGQTQTRWQGATLPTGGACPDWQELQRRCAELCGGTDCTCEDPAFCDGSGAAGFGSGETCKVIMCWIKVKDCGPP